MSISPAYSDGIGVSELLSHDGQRGSGLNQLTCVCMAQAVEREFLRQLSRPNCQLEVVAESVAPPSAIPADEETLVDRLALHEVQEKGHPFVWQKNKSRLVCFGWQQIDAVAVFSDMASFHSEQLKRPAAGIKGAQYQKPKVGGAVS